MRASTNGAAALLLALLTGPALGAGDDGAKPSGQAAAKPVSWFAEVRPILQANCTGCHQPAKAGGTIVLASFDALLASRRHDEPIVVPGQPDESQLLAALLPAGDKPPKMPKGKPPLADSDVAKLRRWISEGAHDDTPAAARELFDQDHRPSYKQAPVVTAVDFAPDSSLLAVSGYHEVLLYEVPRDLSHGGSAGEADARDTHGGGPAEKLVGRLVGMSERINSALFSPDGKRLLVVGGSPARLGEVQVWDVAERKLAFSVPVGFDTLYGGSWSPDGKLVAFGGGDNTVKALRVEDAAPAFFNGAHEDLVLDTIFSLDGSYLVSVSRDRSMKLMQFATQQFIDNITSITPGALKGGLMAVDRHPKSDLLLCGGADGTPKTYNMIRTKDRVIGDDFNLAKAYAPLAGRIFAVEWSPDGARFAVASSADGKGEVRLYAADQEAPAWTLPTAAPAYAVTFRNDGTLLAVGGFDGNVLLVDAATGQVLRTFPAAPMPAN